MIEAPRIILGLDPGIASLGYGIIRADREGLQHFTHGCITTAAGTAAPARLRLLYEGLLDLKARFVVTDVAMESLFYSKNVSTAVAVGQARGVALLATVSDGMAYGEYSPTAVKQAVAGYGGATKRQIQRMVSMILGLSVPPSPDDAADALAVAICHARHVEWGALIARGQEATAPGHSSGRPSSLWPRRGQR